MGMIRAGIVTGYTIGKNRDGDHDVWLLQVQISEPDDIQTVELFSPGGEDNGPVIGSRVIILDLGPAWKIAIAVDDGLTPSVGAGEKKIYSLDGAVIQAFMTLFASGIIHINGDDDFAVRFNALDTALQTLVGSINTVLSTKLDGGGTAGTLSLDISPAKVDTVKLP